MDKDLASIQEVRDMLRKAQEVGQVLKDFDQTLIDQIVARMASKGLQASERLAKLAVDETGFGRYEDKVIKNQFATRELWEYIKSLKTCGVIRQDQEAQLYEIAVPMGTVAGIIPSTNPTSTAMYKAIIALKARNPIILSPHPGAVNCITEAARIMADAAVEAGAPQHSVQCMTIPSLDGTTELMRSELTAIILATGGTAMVRAAYSSGRPALGVGPGNVPAYIEQSADVPKAVADVVAGKSFDHGTVCASEQSLICCQVISSRVLDELRANRCYICDSREKGLLEKLMLDEKGNISSKIVGRAPEVLAEWAGFKVPRDTRVLVVMMQQVGREDPLSCEKLSPVLGFYTVGSWQEGCELSIKILNYGGVGHSMALHSQDEEIIMEFALKKPAMRVLVNTPATHGAIGYTTGLPPALTLGCGTWGGSSTSDNVGPLHLVNIKRLVRETRPLAATTEAPSEHWRYDEQYRYRPPQPQVEKSPTATPVETATPRTYGETRLNEDDVERIIREFQNQQ